jgi:hypothetical protein
MYSLEGQIMKVYFKSFIAGFLSTLIFHQGLFGLLYILGAVPVAPYNMTPVGMLGVPAILSLSFFGGIWGMLIWKLVSKDQGRKHWIKAISLGAVGPTAIAMLVEFTLKGLHVNMKIIVGGLILNAFWGLGNSLLMKLMKEPNR